MVPSTSGQSKFKFTHECILLLLDLFQGNIQKFRDPSQKKLKFWLELSQKFNDMGYVVLALELDKKYRNLKQTYLKLKENRKTRRGPIHWPYYNRFKEIFEDLNDNTESTQNLISSTDIEEPDGSHGKCKTYTPIKIEEPDVTEEYQNDISLTSSPGSSKRKKYVANDNIHEKQHRHNVPQWAEELIKLQSEQNKAMASLTNVLLENNEIQKKRNDILSEYVKQRLKEK